MRTSMRCRILWSGGLMLWVEEMVLCGLSCSIFVRRLCAFGRSLISLLLSVEMYSLSFSLRRTRFIPPSLLGGDAAFVEGGRAFSQASVASLNSTALLGSSILTKTTSLSSIIKSLCKDRWQLQNAFISLFWLTCSNKGERLHTVHSQDKFEFSNHVHKSIVWAKVTEFSPEIFWWQ